MRHTNEKGWFLVGKAAMSSHTSLRTPIFSGKNEELLHKHARAFTVVNKYHTLLI